MAAGYDDLVFDVIWPTHTIFSRTFFWALETFIATQQATRILEYTQRGQHISHAVTKNKGQHQN